MAVLRLMTNPDFHQLLDRQVGGLVTLDILPAIADIASAARSGEYSGALASYWTYVYFDLRICGSYQRKLAGFP